MYRFITFLGLIGFGFSIQGQGECVDTLRVGLGLTPAATISADFVLEGNISNYTNLSWDEMTFNCSNVGVNNYSISGFFQGAPFNCSGVILIEDKLPPVPVVKQSVSVVIPNGTQSTFIAPSLLDSGSYDNCSLDTIYTVPDTVFANQVGMTIPVEFYVKDVYGNSNAATTNVTIESNLPDLACYANVYISVSKNTSIQIEVGDILSSPVPPFALLTVVDMQGNTIENNLVTLDYLGQTLTATITDVQSGQSCWGNIIVDGVGFNVCDTSSRCSDLGTCITGHTDQDNIEWPCNIVLESSFTGSTAELYDLITPANLIENFNVDVLDSQPEIIAFDNEFIGLSYENTILTLSGNDVKVIREWTVIDWLVGCSYDYNQVITINHTGFEEIAFDWPEDITVNDVRIAPVELVKISNVPSELSEPTASLPVAFEYEDELISQNSTQVRIARTWMGRSIEAGSLLDSEIQNITVILSNLENQVSVQDVEFGPFEGVNVNATTTASNGLATTDQFPANYEYSYQHDPRNLNDIMRLREHILQTKPLNEYQQIAGSLSDNSITTLDVVMLQRHIYEIETLSTEWQFLDKLVNLNLPTHRESKVGYLDGNVVVDDVCPATDEIMPGDYVISIPHIEAKPGNTGSFYIYSNGHENVESMTFALKYDTDVISVDQTIIASSVLKDFLTSQPVLGNISFLVFGDPTTVDPCRPIFEVFYTVIGESGETTPLIIDEFENTQIEVTSGGAELNVIKENGSIVISDNPTSNQPRAYKIPIADQLINAGQTYAFDLAIPGYHNDGKAIQLQFNLDLGLIQKNIDSELYFGEDSFSQGILNDQGLYTLMMYNGDGELLFGDGQLSGNPIAHIEFTAKENTLLSKIISEAGSSFATSSSDEVYLLELEIENLIATHTLEEDLGLDVSLYPNPANDYIRFLTHDLDDSQVQVLIMDMGGKTVHHQCGLSQIAIQSFPKGSYHCIIKHNNTIDVVPFVKVK